MDPDVYYLGPEGTFCHEAARRCFPETSHWFPCSTILGVCEAVAADPKRHGVVPIENSTEGGVGFTATGVLEAPALQVVGEVVVDVEHCLVSEGTLETIRTVQSHPHALPQCKKWLAKNLPHAAQIAVASTALSAQNARGRPDIAGIGSVLAAELAGVPVLARGIQDRAHNATRFWLLGHGSEKATGADKTSIVLGAPHERGALYRVLGVFDRHDINLTRIESRPRAEGLWQYVFFIDFLGHRDDANVAQALAELSSFSPFQRVLGSYPRAKG
jgi:chorismate mutase/prephenate dehydratase